MPRIRLRTFFLIFFCAAVGLTIGTRRELEVTSFVASPSVYRLKLDWHYACLAAASVAVVFGLLRQAVELRKLDHGEGATDLITLSRSYSAGWRYLCAGMLIACLLMSLLLSRQVIKLPESESLFEYELIPHVVWIGCIMLTLSASLYRWRRRRNHRTSLRRRYLIFFASAPFIVLLCLPEKGLVHYLVHIATHGIENAQPLVYRRPHEFPEHSAEGFRDFWISLAASVCVFLSAASLFIANNGSRGRHRMTAFGIVGYSSTLLLVASYCIWYYSAEFHRISPYLAGAGAWSNWLERIFGIAIALSCITAIAYRSALREEASITVPTQRDRTASAIHESLICLLVLVVGAALYVYEMAQLYAQYSWSQSAGIRTIIEIVGNLCRNPASLLMILIGLASLELIWLRWRRRADDVPWKICALDPRRFASNWAAIALLALFGIPTLSSFSFVYWLGPWYMYGR